MHPLQFLPGRGRSHTFEQDDLMAIQPTVTVVIPTRDRPHYLLQAVESVAHQTADNVELIVVDDASTTPVEASTLARPATVVRHLRALGPGASRNTGMAHAHGEFLFFLDDDDWITQDRIADGLEAIGEARMHCCPCLTASEGNVTSHDGRRFSGDMRTTLHRAALPSTGQTLFRREDCVQFDPSLRLMEDVEWWVRMWDRAVFSWTDRPGLVIRQHATPRTGVEHDTRRLARRAVVDRHRLTLASDPPSYAYHLRRAGSAAYLAGRRGSAASLAIRSLLASPSRSSAGLLARTLLPLTSDGSSR